VRLASSSRASTASIESRIAAIVQFAGGHDPGPLDSEERPSLEETTDQQEQQSGSQTGPWGSDSPAPDPAKPFLPAQPPVTLGGESPPGSNLGTSSGPWGSRRRN
jgi:heat shock protein HtpX